jgi:hypothetical protein
MSVTNEGFSHTLSSASFVLGKEVRNTVLKQQ